MATVETVGVVSSAKLLGGFMAGVGLIAGIFYSFGGAIYDLINGVPVTEGGPFPTWLCGPPVCLIAFTAIIGMPIIFAASGTVVGALGAILYNLAARWLGGIEVQLEQ